MLVAVGATPPLPPDHLKATASDGTIVLTWNNPTADFKTLAVKESMSSFATTAAVTEPQQAVVLSGFAGTTTTRTGLTNGQTYYYTFFAMNEVGNWSTAATVAATPMAGQAVYRFYNLRAGVHFYTASLAERDNVINTLWSVYRFEGPAYIVNPANALNSQDLYRFYNFKAGVHFYTANAAERDHVINALGGVYRYEGPAYRISLVSDATTFPVYRFYNFKAGVHFYTASAAERDNVINTLGGVYHYEGVAYYVGR